MEIYSNVKVSTLKLSVCVEGQFSCSSGDCIRMEERCDQVVLKYCLSLFSHYK